MSLSTLAIINRLSKTYEQLLANRHEIGETLRESLETICLMMGAESARLLLDEGMQQTVVAVGVQASILADADSAVDAFCRQVGDGDIVDFQQIPDCPSLPLKMVSIFALPVHAPLHATLWLGFDEIPTLTAEVDSLLALLRQQTALAINQAYMQEQERSGREQLSALLANDFEPIIIVDTHYNVQVFNPAAQILFGVSDAVGKPFNAVVESEALQELIRAGANARHDVEFASNDERTFSPHVSEVRSEAGEPRGWLMVLRDVTRFKRLSENMSDFLHTVSHDIRSPMTAAKGYVDMLGMVGSVNETQSAFIAKILTSINDMSNLVEKVLDAGRLDPEMDVYDIRRETCDPAAMINKVVSTLATAAANKHITLKTQIAPNLPIMFIDEMMTERALTNLVENAIKYTPERGEVVVEGRVEQNTLILAVRDNGLGIAPEDLARLFERGQRVRRKEHKGIRGSGLGLFIVRNVARKHSGQATVDSEPGKGSIFSINIPLTRENMVGGGD
ncbi:MAG: PAS domain-containing protein [Anaerolineales bacterium]|nr:PAS domain-containing protein [Anaerolineales bacterium]